VRDIGLRRALHQALADDAPATALLRRVVEGFGPATFGPESTLAPTRLAPAAPADAYGRTLAGVGAGIDAAVERAVAGSDDAVEVALDLLTVARSADVTLDLRGAQGLVYDALAGRRRPELHALGTALGLAVGRLGVPA
jgi:hypothetical protein